MAYDRSSRHPSSTKSDISTSSTARGHSRPPQNRDRLHHNNHNGLNNIARPASASASAGSGTASAAKETFLGYFFGSPPPNGTVQHAFGGNDHRHVHNHNGQQQQSGVGASLAATGRELTQSPPLVGLMAGKIGPDGNNAAFDMKSLGKHIEAVRRLFSLDGTRFTDVFNCSSHPTVTLMQAHGKRWRLR